MIPPPAVNGHRDAAPAPPSESEVSDAKFLYIIIGGIFTAFLVGIIVLVIALASDWAPSP